MRRSTTLLVGGAVAVALALGALVGGVFAESPSAGPSTAAPRALADQALAGAAGGITSTGIAGLEAQVRSRPDDADLLTQLGIRVSAPLARDRRPLVSPAFGGSASSCAPRSSEGRERGARARLARTHPTRVPQGSRLRTRSAAAAAGLGSSLRRHRRRARRARPLRRRLRGVPADGHASPWSLLVRARCVCARADRRSRRRPGGHAPCARRRGGSAGGRRPSRSSRSRSSSSRSGETAPQLPRRAYGASHSSRVSRRAGSRSRRSKRRGGRFGRALAEARGAAEAVPTQQAVALYADLLDRTGRRAEARRQRTTIASSTGCLQANGVQVDLEAAVYRADQGFVLCQTVELARQARLARPSIYGDDALAWALARAGRCREALSLARSALRLDTKDRASLLPSRLRRGLCGRPRRDAGVVRARARAQPRVLDSLGARRPRRARRSRASARLLFPRAGAPACERSLRRPAARSPAGFALASCGGDDDSDTTETTTTLRGRPFRRRPSHRRRRPRPRRPPSNGRRSSACESSAELLRAGSSARPSTRATVSSSSSPRTSPTTCTCTATTSCGTSPRAARRGSAFRATVPGRFEVELEDRGTQIADLTVQP